MAPKTLCEAMAVDAQITPAEVAEAARQGYRAIVNNRPDNEEPGQPSSAEIEAAARAAGLAYLHIPVVPGQIEDSHVEAFGQALAALPRPILAYCRTGTRASMLWALARCADRGVDGVMASAAAAGYDLAALRPRLERRAG